MPSSVPPPPTTPPWVAAVEIRKNARRLNELQNLNNTAGGAPYPLVKPSHTSGTTMITELSSYAEMQRLREESDRRKGHVELVIPGRKTVEIKEAVSSYRSAVSRERMYTDRVIRYSADYIDQAHYETDSYYKHATKVNSVLGADEAKKIVEKILRLAQCLPTQEHLPSTRNETIIRAVVAILRAHNVEGIEGVVGEAANGKDNTDGQKKELGEDGDSTASLAATLTASIGTAVSASNPSGEAPAAPAVPEYVPGGISWGHVNPVDDEPGGEPDDEPF